MAMMVMTTSNSIKVNATADLHLGLAGPAQTRFQSRVCLVAAAQTWLSLSAKSTNFRFCVSRTRSCPGWPDISGRWHSRCS
jgi:hypothetical protein